MKMKILKQEILCDTCGWRVDVRQSEVLNWVDRLCPDCGTILFTEENAKSAIMLLTALSEIDKQLKNNATK